jgi:hypothetical protein
MNYYDQLVRRNPEGISQQDAVQLILWSFCSLDVLPSELRAEVLGRQELVSIFSRLTKDGIIREKDQGNVASLEYWDSLINDFMSGKLELDQSFPSKIPSLF